MKVIDEIQKEYLLDYHKYSENELKYGDDEVLKSHNMEKRILAIECIDDCYTLREMLEDGDYMRRRFLSNLLGLYENTFEQYYS